MLKISKKESIYILIILFIIQTLSNSQVLNNDTIISKTNTLDKIILEFEVSNDYEYDMVIPGHEWFITGWINNYSEVAYHGQFKSINGITYTNEVLNNEKKMHVCLDGEINFKTTMIPYFIIVKPNQTKKFKLLINKTELPSNFFSNNDYKFEIELAIGNNEILSDFGAIFNFELDKYIIDKEEYVIDLKKNLKGMYYFTCEEFNSKIKLDRCSSKIFYLAFKKNIKIIINVKF